MSSGGDSTDLVPEAPSHWATPVLVSLAVFLLLLLPNIQFSLSWDEGFVLARQEVVVPWLKKVFGPGTVHRADLFRKASLDRHWPFSRAEPDGHGPFYCLLSLAGHALTGWFLPPPTSYRVGTITLFALAVGCVFHTLQQRWHFFPALLTVGLLGSVPRVWPEVSYALVDGPLLALSLLAWCAFVSALERRSWLARVGFGLALGLAMATKLTGWFLIIPYLCWSIWQRRRDALGLVGIGLLVALFTTFVVNVGWWPDPVNGVREFFASNLTRAQTTSIPTLFCGRRYEFALPWYNTAVWTVVAMPIGILALGLLGIVLAGGRFLLPLAVIVGVSLSAAWQLPGFVGLALAGVTVLLGLWLLRPQSDPFGLLLLLNWGLLMVVRALPDAPGHDGTRQIVISLAFLTLLAGYAVTKLWQWATARDSRIARLIVATVGLAAVAESSFAAYRYHPLQLSYYSPLIGGLPGAERLGFEPTYFWDAMTPEVLEWINQNTDPGRYVMFRNYHRSWDYLARWEQLRVPYQGPDLLARAQWIVLQHRPGMLLPADRWLFTHAKPAFRKELFGVPLISIYPFEAYAQAQRNNSQ